MLKKTTKIFSFLNKKENKKNKILIIGHARHGKDTLAELLRDNFDFTFKSSSQSAAEIFIYDSLKDKYGYTTPEQCFEDRVNHRAEWYDMICDYNSLDKAKLAKSILKIADSYVGMRDREEIKECINQELFDLIIWVDASKRLALESPDSFNIDVSCADIIIDNNNDLETFKKRVIRLGNILYDKKLI
jgi:dephospho-CoA kinase